MAEKKNTEIEQRVDPLCFSIDDVDYELDFNRESVKYMASKKFKVDADILDYLANDGDMLWHYAFRANHKSLSKKETDELLDIYGGLTPKTIERLFLLYNQALMSNHIIQSDEDLEKNPRVKVKF